MFLPRVIALQLSGVLLCGLAQAAEPKPEKQFFMHKDANGHMVFSDKQDDGGAVLQLRQPSVVTESQLGKKVEYAPAPERRGYYGKHPQVEERERMEAKCARLAEMVYGQPGRGAASRSSVENTYDRECIGNGY